MSIGAAGIGLCKCACVAPGILNDGLEIRAAPAREFQGRLSNVSRGMRLNGLQPQLQPIAPFGRGLCGRARHEGGEGDEESPKYQ